MERRETSVLKPGTGPGASGTAPESAMIGRVMGNFRITSEIGKGGMGVVYLAEHVSLRKRFAIKSLSQSLSGDPNFRRRFFDEAQRQAGLDNPNIVQVTDFFEESGEFFLVMEYVDGQDLSRLITAKGHLTESETLPIFRDILKGVGFAHANGLVHRDIKPSNVLVDKGGRARIMDFGIAIMAGGAEKSLTATGLAIGSPWYMSPEQIVRPQEIDRRTDIYALGIVLYEMLTGALPFDGETDFEVKEQQVRATPPDPREKNAEISPRFADAIVKAMAKEPVDRFQDCGEFLSAIDERTSDRRPSKMVMAVLGAALAVSAGAIIYLTGRQVPKPIVPENLAASVAESKHKVAYDAIQSGSERARSACQQFDELKRKEAGLRSARLIQDANLEAGFKKQIQDYQANIADAVKEYSGFLDQLANTDATIVKEEFGRYNSALERKKAIEQMQIAQMMKRHYERQQAGSGHVNGSLLSADCAALAKS